MADEPTLGELGRLIAGLSDQVRGFGGALAELVRRDVYEAHRQADQAQVARLAADVARLDQDAEDREKDRAKDRAENRRMYWTAVLACIGTIVAGVVTAVVLR